MIAAWSAIENLIRSKAIHRRGWVAGSLTDQEMIRNAKDELDELAAAPDDRTELADAMAVLLHYAIKKDWSMTDLQRDIISKLQLRFHHGPADAKKAVETSRKV